MKTVLITGATGGIGSATARLFKENGYNVVLNYRSNSSAAQRLESETGGIAVCADVGDNDAVAGMFDIIKERYGRLDVLINNAAVQHIGMLCDMTPDEWQKIISTNLTGVFNTTQYALKEMMYSGGKIINISSVWGQTGAACEAAYSATKAGVIGLTRSLAKEYTNVNINCICPGVIDTPMNSHLSPEDRLELLESIPLGRFGTPEEVAELCLFLAEKGAYITGQVIAVNGGMHI